MHGRVPDAHPLDQLRRDAFRIDHGLIRGHIKMEVLLVNAAERTEVRAERRACSFAGVAVDLAAAIPIIIPCPLVHAVADGSMGRMAAPVALPFVRVQGRALQGDILGDQVSARVPVRMVAHPKTLLPRLARDETNDGRAIIGIGAVPPPFIGAAARRITGVRVGRAFFPPRSGTVHRPQRLCQSSPRSARSRSGWLGCAAVRCGAVCARGPTREPGAPWARPWQSRAAAAPAWPVVAASSRTRCRSAACGTHHRTDSGRPENALVHGTGAARCRRSGGI
jgi:hypothetical protein